MQALMLVLLALPGMGKQYTPYMSEIIFVDPQNLSMEEGNPSVSTNFIDYFVVYEKYNGNDVDIWLTILTPSGIVKENFPLLENPWDERSPDIVYAGSAFFVVYEDYRNGDADIYGLLLFPDGTPVGTPFIVYGGAGDQEDPEIASRGEQYADILYPPEALVVFKDGLSLKAIDLNGNFPSNLIVLTDYLIAIPSAGNPYSVTAGTESYFAVWTDDNVRVRGSRISFTGNLVDTLPVDLGDGEDPWVSHFFDTNSSRFFVTNDPITTGNASYIWETTVGESDLEIIDTSCIVGSGNWGDWNLNSASFEVGSGIAIAWETPLGIYGKLYPLMSLPYEVYPIAEISGADNPDIVAGPRAVIDGIAYPLNEAGVCFEAQIDSLGGLRKVMIRFLQFTDSLPAAPIMEEEPSLTPGTSNTVAWQVLPDSQLIKPAYEFYVECALDSSFTSIVATSGWITERFYTFNSLEPGSTYYYKVKGRNLAGEGPWSNVVYSTQLGFDVEENPSDRSMSVRIFPRPFSSELNVEVNLSEGEPIKVVIFDVMGRTVKELFSANTSPGALRLKWDARGMTGRRVRSGIYFVRVQGINLSLSERVVYLRH